MFRTAAPLLALPAPAAAGGDSTDGGRPNVVLFLVDDLGARDLARYGSDFYETPHADALADRGVTFTRAYSAYPRCVPSRVGLLSGKYPARVEAARFALGRGDPARSPHSLPLEEVTFGEAFREAGYRTAYMGKWHLGKEGTPDGGGGWHWRVSRDPALPARVALASRQCGRVALGDRSGEPPRPSGARRRRKLAPGPPAEREAERFTPAGGMCRPDAPERVAPDCSSPSSGGRAA